MPRPTIDLDALRALVRERIEGDPVLRAVRDMAGVVAPETTKRLRELDENLPQVLGGLQAQAGDALRRAIVGELGLLDREMARAVAKKTRKAVARDQGRKRAGRLLKR